MSRVLTMRCSQSAGAVGRAAGTGSGTVYAAPITAMLLGDWGADVIKVEHPRGDPARTHGLSKDGHGLWWKVIARNKRTITLNFSKPEGQDILRGLVAQADVVIENFRRSDGEVGPGARGIAESQSSTGGAAGHGFGQKGPYSSRRAFGTLAEAMSGLAHQTGEETGPPTLPPFGLADGVAALAGAYAVMLALYHRDVTKGGGQVMTCRCWNRWLASWVQAPVSTTNSGWSRDAMATDRATTPPQRLPHQRRPVGGDLGEVPPRLPNES